MAFDFSWYCFICLIRNISMCLLRQTLQLQYMYEIFCFKANFYQKRSQNWLIIYLCIVALERVGIPHVSMISLTCQLMYSHHCCQCFRFLIITTFAFIYLSEYFKFTTKPFPIFQVVFLKDLNYRSMVPYIYSLVFLNYYDVFPYSS